MDDGVRGRPGPTYRAAAILGVRARVWKAGVDFAGDHGRAVARGRRSWQLGPDRQRVARRAGEAGRARRKLGCGVGCWRGTGAAWASGGEGEAGLRGGRKELGQEGRRGKDWARAGFLGRVSVGFGFEFWFSFSISNSNKV